MAHSLLATSLWREAREIPSALRATADGDGLDDVATLLSRPGVRRVVTTGNGAAYYAALALWLVSLESSETAAEVVAIPAGLLASGRFRWRSGDVLLVVSSSGQLRDVIEAASVGVPEPFAAVTANPESPIGSAAGSCAVVHVSSQDAVTHTQAFAGNVLALLAIWARITQDDTLHEAVAAAPDAVAEALEASERWVVDGVAGITPPPAAIALGTGCAWSAALEAALLLKEVARVPTEGVETREGATSAMYALTAEHVALSLPTGDEGLLDEAERTIARSGARVLRAPGGELADPRLAAITTFPAALALSIAMGLAGGHDVDHPGWTDAYYDTARIKEGDVL